MGCCVLPDLTLSLLKASAALFAQELSGSPIRDLFGTTDGKAVGTYVEQKFRRYLEDRFSFIPGNAALGIDFPVLEVDLKATSIAQPQSSSPFKSARQKVYGLGYHLLIFVYDKRDDVTLGMARLDIKHVIFIDRSRTADWQTTVGIKGILERNGNKDDLVAFFEERNLPLDDIGRDDLADQVLHNPPGIGYLTISSALQWRLQYNRAIKEASKVDGIERLYV